MNSQFNPPEILRSLQRCANQWNENFHQLTDNFGRGPNDEHFLRSFAVAVTTLALSILQRANPINLLGGALTAVMGKYSKVDFYPPFVLRNWTPHVAQKAAITLLIGCFLPPTFRDFTLGYVAAWALTGIADYIDRYPKAARSA